MARHEVEREMRQEAEREMREALRLEPFFSGGMNQLVKVIAMQDRITMSVRGFVVQQKFLIGLSPNAIQTRLGLPPGSLQCGCRIGTLQRQPGPSEVRYELTTEFPDGIPFTMLSDRRYPPSDKRFVHQWRLTSPIFVRRWTPLQPNGIYSATL